MTRWFMVLSVLLFAASQVALADNAKKQQWWQQGFKENAEGTSRAMAARSETVRRDDAEKWLRCGAARNAIFTHRELYLKDEGEFSCFEDKDCEIGSLGGMCAVAAHRGAFEAYKLFQKSPDYKFLAKVWKDNQCMGPVGLCLPVSKAYCQKEGDNAGKCQGKWENRHTAEPIFMVEKE